ncbi:MAG: hypothetical protein VXX03_01570, partial [Candidatus Thermoplasmatota archaeon]|nr:hypothetical protein [Candidatus Thermoplasmatota archaeon]
VVRITVRIKIIQQRFSVFHGERCRMLEFRINNRRVSLAEPVEAPQKLPRLSVIEQVHVTDFSPPLILLATHGGSAQI